MGGTNAPIPLSRSGEKHSQCRLCRAFNAYVQQRHTVRSVLTLDNFTPSTAWGGESAPSAACTTSSIKAAPGLGCGAESVEHWGLVTKRELRSGV